MIDKNEQDPKPKTQDPRPKQDRILRAKDIIPGAERGGTPDEESGAAKFDIPRFNLAQDILSAQRRQSTVRRKGPEAAEDKGPGFTQGATPRQTEDRRQNIEHRTKNAERPASLKSYAVASRVETLRDSIIAEIVARDIERLCAGH
ncbi:MAG: hypothetical protein ABSH16_13095 [Sedimentisphaerales bacterium]